MTLSGLAMLIMGVFGLIGFVFVLLFDKPKLDKGDTAETKGSSRSS
jgi:hypothetical protein